MIPYNDPLLDMEGTIGRIIATIEGEGLSVESFICAVDGPFPTSTSEIRMSIRDRMILQQTLEIVEFIECSNINVWEFIFNFLDHRFHSRRPQQHDLRGHSSGSRQLVRGILMSIRESLYEAGNNHVWRDFVQDEADTLNINVDELE
ncbi:uncharacterized protein MELLADRAFT_95308 [Melampsora larici-populina 98AG31]|uniref:Uncharacterized protein n=1 Tax=Melampsora larici-populina (strain 98AG31 / pathotype 3-4-7) TaxID=747676 RepID=F4RCY8_MELLP|nr:uncharacterized protein MELLADRAFT_95308 [Melampsora larici-populina 98AG31]EGG09807.1 hypothetical protein MELLADRAFT_95308 [Melampsora larici-populina 98AG31]